MYNENVNQGLGASPGGLGALAKQGNQPMNVAPNVNSVISGLASSFPWVGSGRSYQDLMKQGKKDISDATNKANQELDPYAEGGPEARQHYQEMLDQMHDPVAFYNSIMRRYKQSEAGKTKARMGMNRIKQAMESEGLTGTPDEMNAIKQLNQQVTNEDMGDFYNRVMNGFLTYLKGYGGLYDSAQRAATKKAGNFTKAGEDYASIDSAIGQDIERQQEAKEAREAKEDAEDSSIMGNLASIGAGLAFL